MAEAWLAGPIEGVDPVLMPAAHAFVQARDDIDRLLSGLQPAEIWARAGQSASIGYHAVHLAGATDRLLTYARGDALSTAQIAAMREEAQTSGLDPDALRAHVHRAIDAALTQIRSTPASAVFDRREVGRQRLPSTVLGLIFHAAEHATRHAGQIATLCRVAGTGAP